MLFPGVPRAVTAARQVFRDLLGDAHPAVDDAELCLSELVTNAVRHSRSGQRGGQVRIEIAFCAKSVAVKVVDDGADGVPHVADSADESGRGISIVEAVAESWGVEWVGGKTAVSFKV
ncbi:ATP-binding protein [Actinocorallia lasiicapitis]